MSEIGHPFASRYKVTSAYGRRMLFGTVGEHRGLDLVGEDYTARAVIDGRVLVSQMVTERSNATWQWGNYVCVGGDDGKLIYYCHLARRQVKAGQRVRAGDILGIMGSTGYSTGDHLHFEVRDGATAINAADYLGIENKVGVVVDPAALGKVQAAVSSTAWSDEAVAWATEHGILYGDGQGNLMLDEPCTRRMVVTFLYRLWKLMGGRA